LTMSDTQSPQTIYISRKLALDSPFWKLEKKGHTVIGKSLLKYKSLPLPKVPAHNAVFFYSRRGIRRYLKERPYDPHLFYGVMGAASNREFRSIAGRPADIIGQGDMKAIAKVVNQRWRGYKVLFPMAKNSLHSMAKYKVDIKMRPLVIYHNKFRKKARIPSADHLVFTSPMNFLAYVEHHEIRDQNLYAIGLTTGAVMEGVLGHRPIIAQQPSIRALYELVKRELKK